MSTPNWNMSFWSNVLKPLNGMAWPALNFGGGLTHLGDYGVLSSVSGGFQCAGNIFADGAAPAVQSQLVGSWSSNYGKFQQTAAGVAVSGSYWDPETQTEVSGGLGWSWEFFGGESILANLPQTNSRALTQPSIVMGQVGSIGSALWTAAVNAGKVKNNQIQPGFVLITSVFEIIAGFVVCSTANKQSWSISGVASGMNLFMEGEVGGFYGNTSEIASTVSYTWPQRAVTQQDESAIASQSSQATIAYLAWQWNGKGDFNEYQPH